MSAHLREAWRARIQRTAWTSSTHLYHLADKVDFRLDPTLRPENNTTLGGDLSPGIFLTDNVEHWVNGYGYWRPWVVEFERPPGIKDWEGVHGGYGGEVYVPAEHYDKLRITRVLPLDAYCREEFQDWGWTEQLFETDFETDQPIPHEDRPGGFGSNLQRFPSGYRYPGDARQAGSTWQSYYKKRVARYLSESGRAGGVYG